jgi:phage terminase large subunit-like protein
MSLHTAMAGMSPSVIMAALGEATLPDRLRLLAILREIRRREQQNLFFDLYPDETTISGGKKFFARRLYARHLEFFEAGAKYRERCFMAANRVGKTFGAGGYELSMHLTGHYPDWWVGRRFHEPVDAWAAGKTNETTRDIIQLTLLGKVVGSGPGRSLSGTGVIPGAELGSMSWRVGVADLIDTVQVKHVSGGWSSLGLKSYQQGRGAFEGTARHVIWLDEEPDIGIYGECMIRTATVGGITMLTFTPLEGMSDTVLQFMPGNE